LPWETHLPLASSLLFDDSADNFTPDDRTT
jgi:hypothetical protein